MSMTCQNLDFGRTVLDLFACGCSSNASFSRSSVRNYAKSTCRSSSSSSSSISRGYGAKKLVDRRRGIASCRVVSSTKTPGTLLTGSKFCVKQLIVLIWFGYLV
jgi:all-trans-nonaprenyl-diphosphate synthase